MTKGTRRYGWESDEGVAGYRALGKNKTHAVLRLYDEEVLTQGEIADKVGTSRGMITKVLRDAGRGVNGKSRRNLRRVKVISDSEGVFKPGARFKKIDLSSGTRKDIQAWHEGMVIEITGEDTRAEFIEGNWYTDDGRVMQVSSNGHSYKWVAVSAIGFLLLSIGLIGWWILQEVGWIAQT